MSAEERKGSGVENPALLKLQAGGGLNRNPVTDFARRAKLAISAVIDRKHGNGEEGSEAAEPPKAPGARRRGTEIQAELQKEQMASSRMLESSNFAHNELGQMIDLNNTMVLERVKLLDVNGLQGRCYRSAMTGETYLKEVELWRDFHLVDLWSRQKIIEVPEEHTNDPHLFSPRPLNMRTWVYHCKFREAFEKFQIGLQTEAFLYEALNERCVDIPISSGLWCPAMVYAPLVPLTLLADDTTVTIVALFIFFLSLIVSVMTNNHHFFFYARPILLLPRFGFFVFTLIRINGGTFQIFGYVLTLFLVLFDLIRGDWNLFSSMRYHCSYEVVRTLPNQIFVCWRVGDHSLMASMSERRKKALPESLTGMKDAGDNTLCLIANIQGLLIELVPVCHEDAILFKGEHVDRSTEPWLGRVKFYGVDLFCKDTKNLAELLDPLKNKHDKMMKAMRDKTPPGGQKSADMVVEDI